MPNERAFRQAAYNHFGKARDATFELTDAVLQIYIVQETGIKEAIAKVRTQHPQETGKLEMITVGGILAPDQVISLDTNLL